MIAEGELRTRQRQLHGVKLWWVCQQRQGKLVPYADIFAPTGYGFKSRAEAERCLERIEEWLKEKEGGSRL